MRALLWRRRTAASPTMRPVLSLEPAARRYCCPLPVTCVYLLRWWRLNGRHICAAAKAALNAAAEEWCVLQNNNIHNIAIQCAFSGPPACAHLSAALGCNARHTMRAAITMRRRRCRRCCSAKTLHNMHNHVCLYMQKLRNRRGAPRVDHVHLLPPRPNENRG